MSKPTETRLLPAPTAGQSRSHRPTLIKRPDVGPGRAEARSAAGSRPELAPPNPPVRPASRTRGASAQAASTPGRLARMLSPADVADLLQVSIKTVRRWIDAGDLRVHTLGRQLRVTEDDLDAFVKLRRSAVSTRGP